jgi:glutathione peroxidase-family protein
MASIKDMIHDIEEASEELLVPKKEDHVAKELLKDLLDRAMTEEEIQEFCTLKYKTTFPLFAKVEVNGKNEEPLFRYLKSQEGGFLGDDIKWNFTKFLVTRDGIVVGRYAPITKPENIEGDILKFL